MPNKTIDLVGQRFGKLVVLTRAGANKYRVAFWLCQCDCGQQTKVLKHHLTQGTSQSCGGYLKELKTIHGKHDSQVYKTWISMHQRCNNVNHKSYSNYGGRGIKVCDRWSDFNIFFEDMGDPPDNTYSIDRYPNNNNSNYGPENCRWATRNQQCRNTRVNRLITWKGETKTLVKWSEITGIRAGTIFARLKKGWSVDEALTMNTINNPYKRKKKKG